MRCGALKGDNHEKTLGGWGPSSSQSFVLIDSSVLVRRGDDLPRNVAAQRQTSSAKQCRLPSFVSFDVGRSKNQTYLELRRVRSTLPPPCWRRRCTRNERGALNVKRTKGLTGRREPGSPSGYSATSTMRKLTNNRLPGSNDVRCITHLGACAKSGCRQTGPGPRRAGTPFRSGHRS